MEITERHRRGVSGSGSGCSLGYRGLAAQIESFAVRRALPQWRVSSQALGRRAACGSQNLNQVADNNVEEQVDAGRDAGGCCPSVISWRRELKGWLTSAHRLLTGTVLPYLTREPDNLAIHGVVSQIEGMLTRLLARCDDEETPAASDRDARHHRAELGPKPDRVRGSWLHDVVTGRDRLL